MCGEKMMKAGSNCAMLGSPPRMRGKDVPDDKEASGHGITPAYAGKSIRAYVKIWNEWGSPPRMRGKVTQQLPVVQQYGITPAYAGKRSWNVRDQTEKEDHPRVCGEKRKTGKTRRVVWGSPPRMRGKEGNKNLVQDEERITPAYAGKRPCLTCVLATLWDHPRVCGEKTSSPAALALR